MLEETINVILLFSLTMWPSSGFHFRLFFLSLFLLVLLLPSLTVFTHKCDFYQWKWKFFAPLYANNSSADAKIFVRQENIVKLTTSFWWHIKHSQMCKVKLIKCTFLSCHSLISMLIVIKFSMVNEVND